MKKAPFISGDGQLLDVGDVHYNQTLAAPQVRGTMRFHNTGDSMRGLVRDICERAEREKRPVSAFLDVSGRSGHSQVGIDVSLEDGMPRIADLDKTIDLPILVTALNPMLAESLADLRRLAASERVDIARVFIPLSEALSRAEIEEAMAKQWLLLPERHRITEDGIIELPLENVRYILSPRLLGVANNFAEMIVKGKHGLSLCQNVSPLRLSEPVGPKEFLVSAMRISLGPYTAFIERQMSHPDVFHLASRLLDGIRTTGMGTLRQLELYNQGESPVDPADLWVRMRLYPADDRVARLAKRILTPARAATILERGVDFADLTDVFTVETCAGLFDEITVSPKHGGYYGRILMPDRMINIPWEEEHGRWMPEFQWRLVYEYARGNLSDGSLTAGEIPLRFRAFQDDLTYVGGEQNLRQVFVADWLPPVDTLRVLKRNRVGVVVVRSLNPRLGNGTKPSFRLDQTAYEELVRLEREGMRFYIPLESADKPHVREFRNGTWVTAEGKERQGRMHTTVAMFGSAVESMQEPLRVELREFLAGLQRNPSLGEGLAVAHGSGPGIMRVVDEVAAELGIFRIGVGIDAETIGQRSNFSPEALVQFTNLALNTRQDILDRHSIFKVFNVGGYGTCYEINMALTFMKICHCLPAPYLFVDPLGLGVNGGHIWEQAIGQFHTIVAEKQVGGLTIEPLGPAWVVNCCHLVRTYAEGLAIIEAFIQDPARYWAEHGVPENMARTAMHNLRGAGVPIPEYVMRALGEEKIPGR